MTTLLEVERACVQAVPKAQVAERLGTQELLTMPDRVFEIARAAVPARFARKCSIASKNRHTNNARKR